MENKEINQKTATYQEQLIESFKEMATVEQYNEWADTFKIGNVNKKQVTILYSGSSDIKTFKSECEHLLLLCACSVTGGVKKIKVIKTTEKKQATSKGNKNIRAAKFFIIGMIFVCMAAAIVFVMGNYISNRNFRETFYTVSSIKVDSRVRVIQLSDLHNALYGEENSKLLERVKELKPDIIICTGDIVNSARDDVDYAVNLAENLSKIAPSYYVYGNNEVETIYDIPLNEKELDKKFGFDNTNRDETAISRLGDSFEEKLEQAGMKVLKNEQDTIKVKNMTVDVYGVLTSNPSSFWSYSGTAFEKYTKENIENLKITAVHEPVLFEEFNPDYWGDLLLAGHTHGGVIRLPVLGPLYTKEGGLLPERSGKFVYGIYNTANSPLIVSGGLENSSLLRVNNEPELVVVDINKF